MPGRTAWLIPSPISAQLLRTRKQDSSAAGTATITAISAASAMTGKVKGRISAFTAAP